MRCLIISDTTTHSKYWYYKYVQLLGGRKHTFAPPLFILGGAAPPRPPLSTPLVLVSSVQCFVLSVVCLCCFGCNSGDHMVEAYSSTSLVMALYVASLVSLCLPHFVEVMTLSMFIVLRALVSARSICRL